MIIFLLIIALIFNLLAQSLLKHAVNMIGQDGFSIAYFIKLMVNPYILSGQLYTGLALFSMYWHFLKEI